MKSSSNMKTERHSASRHTLIFISLISAAWFVCGTVSAAVLEADLCVYGGTSGGVAAAVQGARMGKSVVIVEPGRHLGGMTSGGLSAVDIGDPRSVGGIAREYFTKLAATAGVTLAWDKAFESKGGGPGTGGAYAIEPHKAEQVFDDMARAAGVKVHFNARLASVKKEGARITEIATEDGTVFRAKMFIDATYEGDLMAKAGVSYTLTREGNGKYGESSNGIHYEPKYQPRTGHLMPGSNGRVKGGQGVWDRDFPLDPHVIKGDPKSGLLPLIQEGEPGKPGDPAPGVQAYCYRLCLSMAADRMPIAPPPGYDAKRYEIVVRFIEACIANGDDMDLRWFSKYDALPNEKWDFNTATFGGNLPGASHAWPEASHAEREKIAKEHENYHRGLLHFLATDLRVPAKVRADMQRFGLPRDEFTDNGGWPHQLYIREARRMVSDLVMTEHHTFGKQIAPKPVGLGSYGTDTHEVRRIVKDGVVTREGKTGGGRGGFGPYQIGYGTIVPKQSECENLFVTFALSASHTAFSSIRMEPVFMGTSQSAATAAALAIDDGVPVQAVDYAKLRNRLLADKQILGVPVGRSDTIVAKPMTIPPPMLLKSAAKPEDVNGKSYDLVIIGGTPGGIACAVRAARDGLKVLLVNHTQHLGGMLANGLGVWDTMYDGRRSPIYDELRQGIFDHYRDTYGAGSSQHRAALPGPRNESSPRGYFEPSVAELVVERLVAQERDITVLKGYYAAEVEREGRLIRAVTLREFKGAKMLRVSAAVFADCTYEGDLMAAAKVPYRVGREARAEFDEPHAGVIFAESKGGQDSFSKFPRDAIEGRLNLRGFRITTGRIFPGGTGDGDAAVQAYNFRLCLTRDPANRILPEKPANYRREDFLGRKTVGTGGGPNSKGSSNDGKLPGQNHAYPEGDWTVREAITRRHLEYALGWMYFAQNDESVPLELRERNRQFGLPKDEFTDNGHVPYEMYVREARRLTGRYIFTEHDGKPAPGLARPPIHADSIAITEWPMDSHECTSRKGPEGGDDGKVLLSEETRPGQVPYRCLLSPELDNLLVPVCVSATHVGWGTIRLEPTWMNIAESAGCAAALAVKGKTTPAALDPDVLIRKLATSRMMITFFNDLDVASDDPRIAAAQYFGTKGFFADYNARLDEPLTEAVRAAWQEGFDKLQAGTLDPRQLAQTLHAAEALTAPDTKGTRGAFLLTLWKSLSLRAKE